MSTYFQNEGNERLGCIGSSFGGSVVAEPFVNDGRDDGATF